MDFQLIRIIISFIIALYMSISGKKKGSLSISGCLAAFFVGFISLGISYRFGLILLLFYYTSSKITRYKESEKSKLESDYQFGGQRDAIQVLANSFLGTIVAIIYYVYIGEDSHILNTTDLNFQLWCLYLSHYACATADTWASEFGILDKFEPRLVTSLFLRKVPPGTNGGMSITGTLASIIGGAFIGFIFYILSFLLPEQSTISQFPMIYLGAIYGGLGSLFDSLLGGLFQATYYSKDKKCIIKLHDLKNNKSQDKSIVLICGYNLLTNEQVNAISILLTMLCSIPIGIFLFKIIS